MEPISTKRAFKRHARPILAGLLAGLTLILAQKALANPALSEAQPIDITDEQLAREARTCAQPIRGIERREGIPAGLLAALSLAESGRWNATDRENVAWPWTVTTGGKGHYLPSRVDAVAFVKALQADGVENIDVGCMQINLKYHPDAFQSIEQAFDPTANALYAANFLRERFAVTRSWIEAAGQYHSTTPDLNRRYKDKVTKLWHGATQPRRVATVRSNGVRGTRLQPATAVPDRDLTQRFNAAFRARRTNGAAYGGQGQAIANRYRALQPAAAPSRSGQADGFAAKRQAQIQAWRADHGHLSASAR